MHNNYKELSTQKQGHFFNHFKVLKIDTISFKDIEMHNIQIFPISNPIHPPFKRVYLSIVKNETKEERGRVDEEEHN